MRTDDYGGHTSVILVQLGKHVPVTRGRDESAPPSRWRGYETAGNFILVRHSVTEP